MEHPFRLCCWLQLFLAGFVILVLVVPWPASADITAIDFEGVDAGTLLDDQLEAGQGVIFPSGVEVGTCRPSTCISARSGQNVIRTLLEGEFRQEPLLIRFAAGQERVRIFVHGDDVDRGLTATMSAFDGGGRLVDSDTVQTGFDFPWRGLEVLSPTDAAEIVEVQVVGDITGDPVAQASLLAFDDLSFEGTAPPPPAADVEPPEIFIVEPFFEETITLPDLQIRLFARDNQGFDRISAEIRDSSSVAILPGIVFCGDSATGPCPNASPSGDAEFDRTQSVSLPRHLFPNASYEVFAEACDDAGNCTTDFVRFVLNAPEAPPDFDVRIVRVEVNQGISRRINEVPPQGDFPKLGLPGVPLVRGRTMMVRWYSFIDDPDISNDVREEFRTSMEVEVTYLDGRQQSWEVTPNAGRTRATIKRLPLNDVVLGFDLAEMRADLTRTLNFVIPGFVLRDAVQLQIRLLGSPINLTGAVIYSLRAQPRLGVNVVRLNLWNVPLGPPTVSQVADVFRYQRAVMPVAEVRQLSLRNFRTTNPTSDSFSRRCGKLLRRVERTFGGDNSPAEFETDDPAVMVTAGITSNIGFGGCAYVRDPSKQKNRFGRAVITEPGGDTAAQEISHALGLIHASNAHGEGDGGSSESWPYPHGTMGSVNTGVIISNTLEEFPPFGSYFLGLVDACPVSAAGDTRFPNCRLLNGPHPNPDGSGGSAVPHDYMSYGTTSGSFTEFATRSGRTWVSDITYRRVFDAIVFGGDPDVLTVEQIAGAGIGRLQAGQDTISRTEAFLVDASVHEDGTIDLEPLLRKQVRNVSLDREQNGPLMLQFFDDSGNVLAEHALTPLELTTHNAHERRIQADLPFIPGVRRVVIHDGSQVFLDARASPNPPRVNVLSPNGGEIFSSGLHKVTWEGSDADGDDITYLVQFSPDNGKSWQGLSFVEPGEELVARLNVGEMLSGRRALIRVTASDGINTSVDVSDLRFSVGTDKVPIVEVPVDIKPGSCPNAVNARSRGVLPVAILGSATLDATRIASDTLRLAGVAPLRSSHEDVGTNLSRLDDTGKLTVICDAQGKPDGYVDLALKFDKRAIVAALEEELGRNLANQEMVTVRLTGDFTAEKKTMLEIEGEDVIVVRTR